MLVESKISWATWVLGSEVIEPSNWLFCFGCASEELRVVVANPAEWMANYPPPPLPLGCLPCSDEMSPCCTG